MNERKDELTLKAMEGSLSAQEREELRGLADGDPAIEDMVGTSLTPHRSEPPRPPKHALQSRIEGSRAVEAADLHSRSLRKMGVSMILFGLMLTPVFPLAPLVTIFGSSLILGPWISARLRHRDPYNEVDQ